MSDDQQLAELICERLDELDRQREREAEVQFWAGLYGGDDE
jgi:hypothetical protein